MKRSVIFTILVAGSLGGLVLSWVYALIVQSAMHSTMPASMREMMDAMMGGNVMAPFVIPAIPFFFLLPLALIAVMAVGIVGLGYSALFPDFRNIDRSTQIAYRAYETGLAAIMKTLKPDEEKVMEVLMAHNGKYLQKYIVKESGLTRLKVHRILARFAERGIVTIKEYANTNEVFLSDWLQKEREGG